MKPSQRIFAVKLCELEQEYHKMYAHLQLAQQLEHDQIVQELQALKKECAENDLVLQKSAENSHSPNVALLSEAQRDYYRRVYGGLEEINHGKPGEQTECAALYAEFAVDFAAQAMKHALLAALTAIDLQMNCEEAETNKL